jgi:hypothetical protein
MEILDNLKAEVSKILLKHKITINGEKGNVSSIQSQIDINEIPELTQIVKGKHFTGTGSTNTYNGEVHLKRANGVVYAKRVKLEFIFGATYDVNKELFKVEIIGDLSWKEHPKS